MCHFVKYAASQNLPLRGMWRLRLIGPMPHIATVGSTHSAEGCTFAEGTHFY
jgi:hypothetical protein